MPPNSIISHAFVLPDHDFYDWLAALRPYLNKFERVAVVRSPGGNNLNRFRNVSAVDAPRTWWQDSALRHIRRVYPGVVLVDVIDAQSPAELAPILQRRINADDRYGEQDSAPQHIFQRFVLEWPTSARPLALLAHFNADPELGDLRSGSDIFCEEGADILCAAAGEVTALGSRLQIESLVDGQRYITTYDGVKLGRVSLGDSVETGQVIGQAAGDRLRLVVQNPPKGGSRLLGLENVVNPRDYIYIAQFRLRPTADNLRLRMLPSLYARVRAMVHSWHLLEPREHHGRALERVGVQGSWIKVQARTGAEGYVAAWHLKATTLTEGQEAFPGLNPVGVNLDLAHRGGKPAPARLGKLGWLRFNYDVSVGRGSEDINAALQRYLPHIAAYRAAGYRILFTVGHQVYGEGKSEFWNWAGMTNAKWKLLRARFAEMMGKIAAQWAGRGLVSAWQIWNEPDSKSGVASVRMSARNYGALFAETQRAIRSADSAVQIITAGFNSGPGSGSVYARQALEVLPADIEPDGIAFHPYGRGANGHPRYSAFGHIDESVWAYSAVLPSKPLWITEWGVLDRPQDDPEQIARYALGFIRYLKRQYPGKFAALIWYAWAQGMHNGYGLVDGAGKSRPHLTKGFLSA